MSTLDWLLPVVYLVVLLLLVKPLGGFMARVYSCLLYTSRCV